MTWKVYNSKSSNVMTTCTTPNNFCGGMYGAPGGLCSGMEAL
eukprot:CAMPEP_0115559378 /NCGR_PEP_ID=MMETSP0271-20121206/99925_1 /TAXON_ID=71861 /ORGANISM="Scrippsiella trochoidea, Strain CCMP3099" /LENGTH=41 /DNA_ID= /DNA_START= /DNA_END= /DNA_ORIENTATION=